MADQALITAAATPASQLIHWVLDWYRPPPPPVPVKRKQTILEILLERGIPESDPRVKRARAWNTWNAARAAEAQKRIHPRWSKRWWAQKRLELELHVRRIMTAMAVRLVRKLCNAIFDRWYYVKLIPEAATDDEAAVLYFLRDRTSVPVPHIYLHFRYERHLYIIMDRAPGTPLDEAILTATEEEHEAYITQLAKIFRELRALKTPYGPRICSVTGAGVRDARLSAWSSTGPFEDEAALRQWIVYSLEEPVPSPHALAHDIDHPIVFTHSDLAPRNIMVKDGRITAVIDWEMSGWFPDYWEVTKALCYANGDKSNDPAGAIFKERYVPRILPSYPIELYAEQHHLTYEFVRTSAA